MDRPGHDYAESVADWWREAGVDVLVDDAPRNWLAPEPASTATARPATVAPAAPVAAALPDTLAAFRAWLLSADEVPGSRPARIDAAGDPASGTMIVVDMPEAGDRAAGRLVSGEAGDLLDKMLIPMGLSRETLYLAPLSPARPASGRLDAAGSEALARLMRHHIALVAPRRLLIFGDIAVRALTGQGCIEARGRVHSLPIAGCDIPTIATFHPRFLVQTPARKAAAWADLKLFMAL